MTILNFGRGFKIELPSLSSYFFPFLLFYIPFLLFKMRRIQRERERREREPEKRTDSQGECGLGQEFPYVVLMAR